MAINGSGVTGVSATAYTNSYGQPLSGGVTTLYTLDAASNMLFIQNPANNGTQTNGLAVTLGGSALNFTSVNGFDIPGNVNVPASGSAAVGFGYASLTVGATTGLYQIDLATGAATHLGTVGSGAFAGFTLADRPSAPVITSNGAGGTANLSVAENISAVTIVTAIDADLHALTYAIVGGADAARFTIDASTGALSFIAAPNFEAPTDADGNNSYIVLVMASDGAAIDAQTITVNVTDVDEVIHINGTAGTDIFDAPGAEAEMNGFGGVDTVRFNFNLTEATVTYAGNKVIIDGPSSHTELTGFETYVFTDGTVNNNDGNALVDDLFYYARYHDVWNAQVDADAHYAVHGWHEGRDPSAFFDTSFYLAISADARAAGTNPLTHFDQVGWKEGRIPSLQFDTLAYLAANPDVKAANVNPLAHFLQHGAARAASRARRRSISRPTASTTSTTSPTIPTWRRPASIRSSTSRPSAGRRAAIRTRCSTPTATWRPTPTCRRRTSIRSITITPAASWRRAIRRWASTRWRIARRIRTWPRPTSIRSRIFSISAATRAAPRSRTASLDSITCAGGAPRVVGSPPPMRSMAGRGWGWGALPHAPLAVEHVARPPTPDPSPPFAARMGGGEHTARGARPAHRPRCNHLRPTSELRQARSPARPRGRIATNSTSESSMIAAISPNAADHAAAALPPPKSSTQPTASGPTKPPK